MQETIRIALAGNPNIGKTTLLNALIGSNYSVGNWAGVTVEKKEGILNYEDHQIVIVDLPGTYSLSAYSLDETIARDYIIDENPDIVINLVDASNLERNLYLTMQLLELNKPVIVVLNMMDEASKQGFVIDTKKLSGELGVPVVPIVASQKHGIDQLLRTITNQHHHPSDHVIAYNPVLEDAIIDISRHLSDLQPGKHAHPRWLAIKFLEQDESMLSLLAPSQKKALDQIVGTHQKEDGIDLSSLVADGKYEYISQLVTKVVKPPDQIATTPTKKIDNILTHKYLGLPIFALIMFLVFYFTFDLVGSPLERYTEIGLDYIALLISNLLEGIGTAPWLHSLIVDGILGGVFGIIPFLPLIASLFIALTILEDTGYMARVAFIMDRLMKQIGLSGKAIIPMLLGFGCNVPAIMGTRTLEDENDRLTAILINPFMSCSARLPVYTLFAAAFFPENKSLVIFSLYMLGIVVAILMGLIFKKTLFQSSGIPFIMELPPYRLPRINSVLLQVWEKVKDFLTKAGTVILAASAILWIILAFNFSGPVEMSESIGAMIGKVIAPIFAPLGFGTWQASLSLLSGVVAKEIVVSNMAIIYGLGESITTLGQAISAAFTPLSAYTFMIFTLLYVPCVATIAVIKKETNSWKWMGFSITYQFLVAWIISFIVHSIGLLLGF